jgi:hypothetical protein
MAETTRVNAATLARLLSFLVETGRKTGELPADNDALAQRLREASHREGEGFSLREVRRLLAGEASTSERAAKTAASQILYYLVDRFREPLQFGETMDEVIAEMSERLAKDNPADTTISLQNLRKIFVGETRNPHARTLERIGALFQPAWPALQLEWVKAPSWGHFVQLSGIANGTRRPATFHVNEESLRDQLCGVLVCYRYAFQSDDEKVCREILHVYEDGTGLRWRTSADQNGSLHIFEGDVLPMGGTLFLVVSHTTVISSSDGVSITSVDRGRCIVLYDHPHQKDIKDNRIGLVTSTISAAPHAPCAACGVFVRVEGQYTPTDVEGLMRGTTLIESLDRLIYSDFHSDEPDDPIWVAAFLDNRLAGSIPRQVNRAKSQETSDPRYERDRKIATWQKPRQKGRRDQTVRIDIVRFYDHMPLIVGRTREHPGNRAPFKIERAQDLLNSELRGL